MQLILRPRMFVHAPPPHPNFVSCCMNAWAAKAIWPLGRQSVSGVSSETTKSEKIGLPSGGAAPVGAFPRSLIRDSDSAEEVRRKRRLGRWRRPSRRRKRAKTGCTGIRRRRGGKKKKRKRIPRGPLNHRRRSAADSGRVPGSPRPSGRGG